VTGRQQSTTRCSGHGPARERRSARWFASINAPSTASRFACLSDRHKAEDLAQEVFLQLHRSLGSIESDAHLLFWLRRVTTNRAIDRLRQEARYVAVSLEACANLESEGRDADPMLQRRLREMIAQLPPL
jgi:DNA-directed RNA polymerase specialized sigma24 family protein